MASPQSHADVPCPAQNLNIPPSRSCPSPAPATCLSSLVAYKKPILLPFLTDQSTSPFLLSAVCCGGRRGGGGGGGREEGGWAGVVVSESYQVLLSRRIRHYRIRPPPPPSTSSLPLPSSLTIQSPSLPPSLPLLDWWCHVRTLVAVMPPLTPAVSSRSVSSNLENMPTILADSP